MTEILLGSHVGMSGKEMFLGSVKEAAELRCQCADGLHRGTPEHETQGNRRTET